jgi:hypothetical protein
MSETKKTEHPKLDEFLNGTILYGIHGILRHSQIGNQKKPFSGHFEFNALKQSIEGFMIDPLVNEGLVSVIKGGMGKDYLEFMANDQVTPGSVSSYQFEKVGEHWTKDGNLYVWRGVCKFNGELGDASCTTSIIIPDTTLFKGQYGNPP